MVVAKPAANVADAEDVGDVADVVDAARVVGDGRVAAAHVAGRSHDTSAAAVLAYVAAAVARLLYAVVSNHRKVVARDARA